MARASSLSDLSSVALTVDTGPMEASLAALGVLAEHLPEVGKRLLGLCDVGTELVRFEYSAAAGRAGEIPLSLYPSDRFLEVVAAIRAIDPDLGIVEVSRHGWPILSLRCDDATMTEAGGGGNTAPGGGPAA